VGGGITARNKEMNIETSYRSHPNWEEIKTNISTKKKRDQERSGGEPRGQVKGHIREG